MVIPNPYKKQRTMGNPWTPPRPTGALAQMTTTPPRFTPVTNQVTPSIASPPSIPRVSSPGGVVPAEGALVVQHMPGSPECVCASCLDGKPFASVVQLPFKVDVFGGASPSAAKDLLQGINRIASVLEMVPVHHHGAGSIDSVQGSATISIIERLRQESASIGLAMDGARMHQSEVYSEVVLQSLLRPMNQIGVYNLATAAHYAKLDEGADGLRIIDPNFKGSFFFTPQMVHNKAPSYLNNKNKLEFYAHPDTGAPVYYKQFWHDNMDCKNRAGGGTFRTIEVGARLPAWTIPDLGMDDHLFATEWMKKNGPVMPNGLFYLSMKEEYCTVFLRNMGSELVAQARSAGFLPLFLIKNVICGRTAKFGVNGQQFTTINLAPKSYLALVAFYQEKDGELNLITIKNNQDTFMVMRNDVVV